MNNPFGETLRKLRLEKGLSQKQLGDLLFIDNSAIARWESGKRLPNAMMVTRLAGCLGVDSNTLFRLAASVDENPNIIMVLLRIIYDIRHTISLLRHTKKAA